VGQVWQLDFTLSRENTTLYCRSGKAPTLCGESPGKKRTQALLERGFYWPSINKDVDEYVRTCLICQ
jgi:hypothetical protein